MPGPNAYRAPRRAMSGAVTVQVSNSPLKAAIAGMSSGQFADFVQPSFWMRTQDPREPTASEGIAGPNYRWASPTEQGDTGHALGYTIIDWGGKVCWDPIGRRVMFAANGANPGGTTVRGYSHQYNKFSWYDEATNAWGQERGVKGDNEGADPDCIVHLLGNNCIDVAGRRFFKKKFRESPGRILVKNLTSGSWSMIEISGVSEASYNRSGGLDFVPGRGAAGMLWGALTASSGLLQISEIDPSTGVGSTLVASASIGNQNTDISNGMPCVYNPRAFGGAGGVLVGHSTAYKLTIPPTGTPTVYNAGACVVNMSAATGHRVCRDPVGDGWYHFVSSTGKIYRTAGNAGASTWTEVATMPANMAAMPNMVLAAIDIEGASDYGAIWVLCSYSSSYASQNNHNAWLWKP
jgi:hypothetical protein